jgi:hypothetical protein
MKKHLLYLILPLLLLASAGTANAQYKSAIGLRLSYYPGITFKHHISDAGALEFIADTRWGGLILTGLYEHHIPLGPENLNLYFGGGLHVGFYNGKNGNRNWDNYGGGAFLGIDGILGLEYTLTSAPINFSLDYKPSFNFAGYSGFWGDGGAISIRYVFGN